MFKRSVSISCLAFFLLLPWTAHGDALTVAADDSVAGVLAAQQGKRVTVMLRAGSDLTGTVALVNDDVVHLRELAGKEFFDAVVALPEVAAVVIRTRR